MPDEFILEGFNSVKERFHDGTNWVFVKDRKISNVEMSQSRFCFVKSNEKRCKLKLEIALASSYKFFLSILFDLYLC